MEDTEIFKKPLPIGFNLYLEGQDKYYRIQNREPFNVEETYDEIAPGAETERAEEDIIQPSENVIYQTTLGIKHKVSMYWWQPSSTRSLGTDREPDGHITPEISPFNAPNKDYTLFLPPEESIHVNLENESEFATFEPEVRWSGYKYMVLELDTKPEVFLTVPTKSFGG